MIERFSLASPDAFNGLSMVGHLKLAHLDLQSLNSFVFRGLRHVQVRCVRSGGRTNSET